MGHKWKMTMLLFFSSYYITTFILYSALMQLSLPAAS